MKTVGIIFLLAISTASFAKDDPEIFCFEKAQPSKLYSIDDELDGGACDDALNLLSIYAEDYGLCYKGSVKEVRADLAEEPIEYTYYGNQYQVEAVLSPKDKGGDVIKIQNRDLDSKDPKRLVNIIGEIPKCK